MDKTTGKRKTRREEERENDWVMSGLLEAGGAPAGELLS